MALTFSRRIQIALGLDARGFQRGLKRAESATTQFQRRTETARRRVRRFGTQLQSTGRRGGRAFARIGGAARLALRPLTGLATSIGGITSGALAAAAAIGVMVAAFSSGTKEVLQLEKAFSEVDVLLIGTGQTTADFKEDLDALSIQFGIKLPRLVAGLYDAISAGIPADNIVSFLNTSSQLAIAGVADVKDVVDLLSSTVNAFGIDVKNTEAVADILLKTVQRAKTTIPQLAGSLGQLSPIAKVAGVTLPEMTAALAGLTLGGVRTDNAVVQLKATINSIIAPSTDAAAAAKRLGLGFSATALQSRGLVGILKDISKATGGNVEEIRKLFPNIRALGGVAAVTGVQLEKVIQVFEEMFNATGFVREGVKESADDMQFKLGRAVQAIRKGFRGMGQDFINVVASVSESSGGIEAVILKIQIGVNFLRIGIIKVSAAFKPLLLISAAVAIQFGKLAAFIALISPPAESSRKRISEIGLETAKLVVELRKLKEIGPAAFAELRAQAKLEESFKEIFGKRDIDATDARAKAIAEALSSQKKFIEEEILLIKDEREKAEEEFANRTRAFKTQLQEQERAFKTHTARIAVLDQARAAFNESIEERIFRLRIRGQTPEENIGSLLSAAREFESRANQAVRGGSFEEARRLLGRSAEFFEEVANIRPEDLGLAENIVQELERLQRRVNEIFVAEVRVEEEAAARAFAVMDRIRNQIASLQTAQTNFVEALANEIDQLENVTLDPNIDPFVRKLDLLQEKADVLASTLNQLVVPGAFPEGPFFNVNQPAGFQHGGIVPGSGIGDKVAALLEPGETVINRRGSKVFAPLLQAINRSNPVASPPVGAGGVTTNTTTTNSIGDVTVQLESRGNAEQDARALGKELRRLIRRKQLPGFG